MKSFIPWVGGKSKLLWLIRKLSPSRYSRFIDVFGGSGTVTLSRPIQPGCMEVYNDFNSDLTNLFCCVKNRTMALLLELGFLPLNTRDDFNVLYKFFSKEEFTDDYMASSAAQAQGYERVSKYPKSTKYGRQNPITERWNSDEQLVLWRAAWADVANRHLERTGHEERIDHRSHAERGLLEQPTVHEGVVARAMEKKGIISDRCELNRQIKADNALLRELRGQVKKLAQTVKNTIPALAEAMENLRKNLLLFCYQMGYLRKGKVQSACKRHPE